MKEVSAYLSQMTVEEKASLCSGKDAWRTKPVERLGVPSIMMSDGPHGLRKQVGEDAGQDDSIEAVCFPTACAMAASFDRELLCGMGHALGEECVAEDVAILLGPAVNMKRSPLCGRNFEYFSEDPYLCGELAAAQVRGIEATGTAACVKHFALNNQEYRRMTVSSNADETAMREIYLSAFETVVKTAKPGSIMCSYNRINGLHASDNRWLLTELLREEWGFDGMVISDWGAVNDRVKGVEAGMDLEMPASGGETDKEIVHAVKKKALSPKALDLCAGRVLAAVKHHEQNPRTAVFNRQADHKKAADMAAQCAVLLKNEGALPLDEKKNVVFIGAYAKHPRFQGGGSSHINAGTAPGALEQAAGFASVTYEPGFAEDGYTREEGAMKSAINAAKHADAAVIFAGLPTAWECEGYDRAHMRLPDCQNELISAVAAVQPNTVVALHNGSPVELPWAEEVNAILELYLAGEGVGEAAAQLLYGRVNPSGKLPETFPLKLADYPAYLFFPGDGVNANYQEGIFIGYRYYDKKEMPVRYPFGHGLSYTSFAYSDLTLSQTELKGDYTLTVTVKVTNTGDRAGAEAAQLYIGDETGAPSRPVKQLKGFQKLYLEPGETKTAEFSLDMRSFAYYEPRVPGWRVRAGRYRVLVGSSSADIRLGQAVTCAASCHVPLTVSGNTTVGELLEDPRTHKLMEGLVQRFMPAQTQGPAAEAITPEMTEAMVSNAPLRSLRSFVKIPKLVYQGILNQLGAMLKKS